MSFWYGCLLPSVASFALLVVVMVLVVVVMVLVTLTIVHSGAAVVYCEKCVHGITLPTCGSSAKWQNVMAMVIMIWSLLLI